MSTIGIVGGLGTETSCSFCFNINSKIKNSHQIQPHLIMDNVPVPDEIFHKIANGEHNQAMFNLLKDSVTRLNQINSDLIVIPCNTVHIFIDQLRKISKTPILSIIEETAKKCVEKSFKKVGVLGSTTTTKSGLYKKELNKHSIKTICLNEINQRIVTDIIIKILNLESNDKDAKKLLKIIQEMKDQGAEAVILGCTDLFLLVKEKESVLPVIDSTKVLEQSVVSKLMN